MRLGLLPFFCLLIFSSAAHAVETDSWIRLKTPVGTQTSQLEAGLPVGCEITALLYALKLGPEDWRKTYLSFPGATDLEKIKFLARHFSEMQSQSTPGKPAFSEKWGANPNDLPWMFRSFVKGENLPKLSPIVAQSGQIELAHQLTLDFRAKVGAALKSGRPVIAEVMFPSFGHAVLITGISNANPDGREFSISILDPLSGKESIAQLAFESVKVVGVPVEGLSFFDFDVFLDKGVLLLFLDN